MSYKFQLFCLTFLFLIACTEQTPTPTEVVPTAVATSPSSQVSIPTFTPTPQATPTPEAIPTSEATLMPATSTSLPPTLVPVAPIAKERLAQDPITVAELETFEQLLLNYPSDRDDVALAVAYGDLDSVPNTETPLLEPLTIGIQQNLSVNNTDNNTYSTPRFELIGIGQYAYFWYEDSSDLSPVTQAEIDFVTSNFDQIYEEMVALFGSEPSPGADGDPRIHVVNAAPSSICNSANACGLLGYYSGSDRLPLSVNPHSNVREMFVMNGTFFGTSSYLDTLAHEFRHMIEDNYDSNDWDWEVEGSAVLAEDLLGYPSGPLSRGNLFLNNPDQQLNRWTDGNPLPYYGQGYVLNRYIYNRLGEDLYREFAQSPLEGFTAIDAVAQANGLPFDGLALWLDWLIALAIHTDEQAPAAYALRDGLERVNMMSVSNFPFTTETTANQYAADYYRFFGDETITIQFQGSSHTQLMPILSVSGEQMWVANRANNSQMQLTREFDLSDVDTATLNYWVYHYIEQGYDFAYVSISTDGGTNWTGLTGEFMQGEQTADDPANVAYTERFYTGRSNGWQQEQIDLASYTGQSVHIRFEYVTDPILTFDGWALDEISIPEIAFFDSAEDEMGWVANGFVRATSYLPQAWYVQLITYDDAGVPQMNRWLLNDTFTHEIEIALVDYNKQPILIIAPIAPMALLPAHYQLTIEAN